MGRKRVAEENHSRLRTSKSSTEKSKRTKQNLTAQNDGADDDHTVVKISTTDVCKWPTLSTTTLSNVMSVVQSNINSLLVHTNRKAYEETQEQLVTLKKQLRNELSQLKGPQPSENYSRLEQEQGVVNEDVCELAEDQTMVQDEIDRLRDLIDKNKSELLRVQQKVTILQNKINEKSSDANT